MCSLWVWKGHILNDTHCQGHGAGGGKIQKRFTGSFSITYAHFLLSSSLCRNMVPLVVAHLFFSIIHRLTVLFSCMQVAVIYLLGNDCRGNWLLKWRTGAQVNGSVYHIIDFLMAVPHAILSPLKAELLTKQSWNCCFSVQTGFFVFCTVENFVGT